MSPQVAEDKADDAPQVSHALLEVVIPDLRKLALVPLKDVPQGGLRIQPAVADGRLHLFGQHRVGEQQPVRVEDVGVLLIAPLGRAGDPGVELLGRGGAGALEPPDLVGSLCGVQLPGRAVHRTLIETISTGDGYARSQWSA